MHQFKLGQYKGLNIQPQPLLTDEDLTMAVSEAISKISYQWTKKNKPIVAGDEIIVSINASYGGQIVPELCKDDFKLTVGAPKLQQQFNNALGKKEGELFEMNIVLDSNNPIERVRGKCVHFEVDIQEVLPYKVEINDEIALKLDPSVANMDELKSKYRQIISANALQVIRQKNLEAVFNAIIKNSVYQFDPIMFNKVYEPILEIEKKNFLQEHSNLLNNTFEEPFYAHCRDLAETAILDECIMEAVAKKENIALSDQIVYQKKLYFLEQLYGKEEEFKSIFPSEEEFRQKLFVDEICDFLLDSNLSPVAKP